jgi:hypothetical protein
VSAPSTNETRVAFRRGGFVRESGHARCRALLDVSLFAPHSLELKPARPVSIYTSAIFIVSASSHALRLGVEDIFRQ